MLRFCAGAALVLEIEKHVEARAEFENDNGAKERLEEDVEDFLSLDQVVASNPVLTAVVVTDARAKAVLFTTVLCG
jgi:hypothetical protein